MESNKHRKTQKKIKESAKDKSDWITHQSSFEQNKSREADNQKKYQPEISIIKDKNGTILTKPGG